MKTSERLNAAADLIERVGWCQRRTIEKSLTGQITGYCVIGAIEFTEPRPDSHEMDAALNVIRDYINDIGVASWNDAESRTKEQVISTLRDAAKHEEREST